MKKSFLILCLVIFSTTGFYSCSEFNDEPEIQGIGQSLQSFVDSEGILYAFIYESRWDDVTKSYDWDLIDSHSGKIEIRDHIVRVGNYYYNLNYLVKFDLYSSTAVNLYFKVEK